MSTELRERFRFQSSAAYLAAQAGVSAKRSCVQYQRDPVAYVSDVLKVKELSSEQVESLESIRDNRYTVVKASHAVGKTFTAACALNWWYDCWDEHIGYVTAPTWPQALGLTFKQLKRQRRQSGLRGRILETGLVVDEDKNREPAHFIRALNAEKGEGFQGEHSAPILIVIEEGPGVPHYIWEAAGGLMTRPECRLFAIGNPTDEATDFGLACESPLYREQTISALNHPNIAAELICQPPSFPDAVRLQWLYEMLLHHADVIEKEEEDSFEWYSIEAVDGALNGHPVSESSTRSLYMPDAYFQSRAAGLFPTQVDKNVIPKNWLNTQPVLIPGSEDKPEIGCDVARFGDDRTTIFSRVGPCFIYAREIRKMDTVQVENALKDEARKLARWCLERAGKDTTTEEVEPLAKTIPLKIDVTGGLGAGPYDHLRAEGWNAMAVNSSNKARNEEQYKNVRSELWFDTRERARQKRLDFSRLPKDIRERLIKELSAPKWKPVTGGQKEVESKEQMKKRLGYSPDLADGANLACARATGKEMAWA